MTKSEKKSWKKQPERHDAILGALPARLATMAGIGKPIGKAARRNRT